MKRFIICLALLTFTFCSYLQCSSLSSLNNLSLCKSVEVEDYDGFSCFKTNTGCIPFPKDAGIQKAYLNLLNGIFLETLSKEEDPNIELYV